MIKRVVRFGVVGCGSVAEAAHFPSLQGLGAAELVATCDLNRARAEQAARKWGAAEYHTDLMEMLQRSQNLDALIIATPNAFHRDQAVAAAQNGLHVLVEKPLAVTNFEAWEIVRACEQAHVKLMVGCDRRFWLQNQWAKELIEEGVIGTPLMARASLHEHWRYYQGLMARTDFRLKPEIAGGAAISDIGSHAIDLATWLVGRTPSRVVGLAARLATDESVTLCDDTAVILIEHEGGAVTTISCNRFSPVVSQATEIYGSEGTILTSSDSVNPFQSVPMAVYTNRQYSIGDTPEILRQFRWPQDFWAEDILASKVRARWIPIIPPRVPNNYFRMLESFVNCIIDDSEPLVSGADGARAVEVMCAVHLSVATEGWVDLPLQTEVRPPNYPGSTSSTERFVREMREK